MLRKVVSDWFEKDQVQFLGRAGMFYKCQAEKYFIDSEMSFDGMDMVVFGDPVKTAAEFEARVSRSTLSEATKAVALQGLLDHLQHEKRMRIQVL
ncbi:hypothetical protein ASU33_15260 [Solirubrum puertoriconensis]|uniref:Uncharacterized protein n=2 Tax=Solirubrum puertoriconensis TaxID=1751427 RepID=A0A9X0HKN2_SOLP1|nr:hypothetical protein ASU33_15260 [Solirubrum puertoriconensis]